MLLILIGIVVLAVFINFGFYEYRVIKKPTEFDIFQAWVQKKLSKRYKI